VEQSPTHAYSVQHHPSRTTKALSHAMAPKSRFDCWHPILCFNQVRYVYASAYIYASGKQSPTLTLFSLTPPKPSHTQWHPNPASTVGALFYVSIELGTFMRLRNNLQRLLYSVSHHQSPLTRNGTQILL
jgi:hypothetical protein